MALSITGLYPGTKFVAALFLGVTAFIVPTYWYGLAAFLVCIVLGYLAGEGNAFVKTIRNSLLILVVFMFVIRMLFSGGSHVYWAWGNLSITQESLDGALTIVAGVLALGSALLLFFRITPVKDITAALENAGMPPSATYVVLSAIQMIPEMRKQSATIMDAQKTRGVETEGKLMTRVRAFIPTLGPLVLSSIASTEERVITLESRAFTARVPKTRLYTVTKRRVDVVIQLVLIVLFVLILAGRIALWLL
jgi:ABC-type cobalt transport system, permease component CbiQ and related transporters